MIGTRQPPGNRPAIGRECRPKQGLMRLEAAAVVKGHLNLDAHATELDSGGTRAATVEPRGRLRDLLTNLRSDRTVL